MIINVMGKSGKSLTYECQSMEFQEGFLIMYQVIIPPEPDTVAMLALSHHAILTVCRENI